LLSSVLDSQAQHSTTWACSPFSAPFYLHLQCCLPTDVAPTVAWRSPKGMFPRSWHNWEVVKPLRGGPSGMKWGHWGYWDLWPPISFLCFLDAWRWTVFLLHLLPPWCSASPQVQNHEPSNHELKPLRPWAKTNPLFKVDCLRCLLHWWKTE
jgi:hypothetical protein